MSNTFHLLSGTLCVDASGYWYTGGGEKGSFGYYPHLKDREGRPVYPDTQLHGDLRMAALWAKALGVEATILDRLFGKNGNETAALLHIGDLSVPDGWNKSRFQVKPRIEINDDTRSVRQKMLANFEAAWLEGLTLTAPIYAGYFADKTDAEKARELLDEASWLLSGFGALRSRGYGRREKVKIDWRPMETVTIAPAAIAERAFTYRLTSLVNLRSKPVAAERLQLVGTSLTITAEQLRGWFVRSYHAATGAWPTADQMAGIAFTDLIPTPGNGAAAYPPPSTTLRREDGTGIEDYWNRPPKEDCSSTVQGEALSTDEQSRKNKVKLKPLAPGCFVTEDGKVHSITVHARMRNAMGEEEGGGTFTTRENGLFVQQYLDTGTCFSGQIALADTQGEFARTAYAILSTLKPVINGSILSPELAPAIDSTLSGPGPRVVIMPLPYDPSRECRKDEGITIGTQRRYAPALGRPRRGLPAILPGSVLVDEQTSGTVAWGMFGKALPHKSKEPQEPEVWEKPEINIPLARLGIKWDKITRSQAGILRELLNPDHNRDSIAKFLKDIRDKHTEKNPDSPEAKLYQELTATLENKGIEGLTDLVKKILDYLKAEIWWNNKKPRADGSKKEV